MRLFACQHRDRWRASKALLFHIPAGVGEHPMVGQPYGQPTLSDGRLLDAHLGQRFALLARAEFLRALTPGQEQTLRQAHVLLLADTEPAIEHWLSREQISAVLLRPDRYIAATANSAADVPAMLALLPT